MGIGNGPDVRHRRPWCVHVRPARHPACLQQFHRQAGESVLPVLSAGGHENYFDELMAIMEASQGRPDAYVVADLRARYDIEQITGLH